MRSERGEFNLVGLLVAVSIFLVVLMATYSAFDVFTRNARDTQVRTEATDRARTATDQMARQLRNLATPTALQPNAVALASEYDVVFETVSPTGVPSATNPQNIQFVRYCLDGEARKLWAMDLPPATIAASTVAPSTTGPCPGSGWSNSRVIAHDIVNRYSGAAAPVFAFDSTANDNIRRVRFDLWVDTDPGRGPAPQQVTTGVNLRNQDRAPTAKFIYTLPEAGVALLDGTSSTDADNDPLKFCWYDAAATSTVGDCGAHSVGASATLRYRPTTTGNDHTITLTVTDPSGLPSSATKTFRIP